MRWLVLAGLVMLVSLPFAAFPEGVAHYSKVHNTLRCQLAYFGAGFPDGTPSLLNLSHSFCIQMGCPPEQLAETEALISALEAHDAMLSAHMQAGNRALFEAEAASAREAVQAASGLHATMVRKYFWYCYLSFTKYSPAFAAQLASQRAYFDCLKAKSIE